MCAAAARGAHSDWAYNKVSSVLCWPSKIGLLSAFAAGQKYLIFYGVTENKPYFLHLFFGD
jgi:hypothetical protein